MLVGVLMRLVSLLLRRPGSCIRRPGPAADGACADGLSGEKDSVPAADDAKVADCKPLPAVNGAGNCKQLAAPDAEDDHGSLAQAWRPTLAPPPALGGPSSASENLICQLPHAGSRLQNRQQGRQRSACPSRARQAARGRAL